MNSGTGAIVAVASRIKSGIAICALGAVVAVGAVVVPVGDGWAASLASHRAFYKVELGSVTMSSGVVGLSGAEVYSFTNSCDGWVVEVNTLLSYQFKRGDAIKAGWNFSAWEAKDGLSYRFTARRTRNGETIEKIRGRASLDSVGGAGMAAFSAPEVREVKLPAGAVFPTRHLIDLIERAEAGQRAFIGVIFDGASLDNPFEVNTVIGPSRQSKKLTAEGGELLASSQSWPARLAYFPVLGENSEPQVELAISLRDDGVASRFEQDFGDYSIVGTLQKVETFRKPDC